MSAGEYDDPPEDRRARTRAPARRSAPGSGRRTPRAAPPSRPPSPTSISPAASPFGRDGISWSWIQRIHAPSGARDGSTAIGWPTTTVASAGSSPRSRLVHRARDAVEPGRQVDDRRPAEPLVARPPRRLGEREVDLHLASAVAEPAAPPRRRPVAAPGAARTAPAASRSRAPPASPRSPRRRRSDAGRRGPTRRRPARPPARSRTRRPRPDDPGERLDQRDAAAARDRHPPELDRDADHLRHEPRRRRVGPEPGVQHPRREQPPRPLVVERLRSPVAARRSSDVPGELDKAAPAEPAQRPRAEPRAVARPQLGAEQRRRRGRRWA